MFCMSIFKSAFFFEADYVTASQPSLNLLSFVFMFFSYLNTANGRSAFILAGSLCYFVALRM
jgi:hypothetical protein